MNLKERKEWLKKQINHLEDLSLWGDLSEQDEIWLESYKQEYKLLLEYGLEKE